MHRVLLLTGLLLVQALTLGAQQNPRTFEAWNARDAAGPATELSAPLRLKSVQVPRRDYRYEGLLVGGVAFGAVGAWLGSRITEACPTEPGVDCSPDRLGNAVALGLVGAAVGGGLGYLVGRLSSKPSPGVAASRIQGNLARRPSTARHHLCPAGWIPGRAGLERC
jgi:hypothetical protein